MERINNVPAYAYNHRFIVCVGEIDNMWFYGAYDDFEKAANVAAQVDGIVIQR